MPTRELAVTWRNVEEHDEPTAGKVTALMPATAALGGTTTLDASLAFVKGFAGGRYRMVIKSTAVVPITILDHKGDLATSETLFLPFSLGTVAWSGIPCPVEPCGELPLNIDMTLTASLPSWAAKTTTTITATAGDGTRLLSIEFKLAPYKAPSLPPLPPPPPSQPPPPPQVRSSAISPAKPATAGGSSFHIEAGQGLRQSRLSMDSELGESLLLTALLSKPEYSLPQQKQQHQHQQQQQIHALSTTATAVTTATAMGNKQRKPSGRLARCWACSCGTWRRGLCCMSMTGLAFATILLPLVILVVLPVVVGAFIDAATLRVQHMNLVFQNGFFPVTTTLRIDNAGPVPVTLRGFNATLAAPAGLQAATAFSAVQTAPQASGSPEAPEAPEAPVWTVPEGFPMGWMRIPQLDIAGNAPSYTTFHETIYPTNGTALGAAMSTLVLADSDKSLHPADWHIRGTSTVVVLGFHVPVTLDKVLEWPPYPVDDWLNVCFNPPNCTWQ